jgi:hypothetical protein
MRYRRRVDQYCSRREIDMAIGALIGMTHCSQEHAFDLLAAAVHHTGAGLGAVSAALIALAGEDTHAHPDPNATSYWQRTLDHPTHAT